jgi:response regulator RpfG family c-di-GMP phosphodiesterase
MSSVLLVDDEDGIRALMSRWLEGLGHETRQASSAEQALEQLAREDADVAVCDIAMPGQDGLWLASQLRADHPQTAVIMATGTQDVDAALRSLQHGAVDYLVKPFTRDQFREALGRGIEWHREAVRSRRRLDDLDRAFRERLEPLEERLRSVPVVSDSSLEELVSAFSGGDRARVEHSQRVASLAMNIALSLGVRNPELSDIERGARLHDIGKFAMPKDILCKPGTLSDEERSIVRRLPVLVYDILRVSPFLAAAAELVRSVYERFDGLGYPWALRGEEIPIGARIIAVADAFDTMTHRRVHSGPRAMAEAIFEIQRFRGLQFDPQAVDALFKVVSLHWHRGESRVAAQPVAPVPAVVAAGLAAPGAGCAPAAGITDGTAL